MCVSVNGRIDVTARIKNRKFAKAPPEFFWLLRLAGISDAENLANFRVIIANDSVWNVKAIDPGDFLSASLWNTELEEITDETDK